MKKIFKRIMACTLAGAIIAGSFGGYSQVNAKEGYTDNIKKTVIESEFALYDKTIDGKERINETEEKDDYVIMCNNSSDEDKLFDEYGKEIISDVDDYDTSEDNIMTLSLSEKEYIDIKTDTDVLIEKDYGVVENWKLSNANRKRVKKDYYSNHKIKGSCDEWNMNMINDNKTKDIPLNKTKDAVKVAIIDSGVDIGGDINVYQSISLVPEDENVSPMYYDITGHGTSVAGIIASTGKVTGLKGINPNVQLYSVKVLDNNMAPVSRIIEAIYWCIDNDIDIINMSFGTPHYSVILEKAIKDAYEKNILMIASSGNEKNGELDVEYPAAFDEVVSVGSVNSLGEVSEFCDACNRADIYAPGEMVNTVGYFGGTIITSGTSIAAPHVTGVASLLLEKDSDYSNHMIKELLIESSNTNHLNDDEQFEVNILDEEYSLEIINDFKKCYIQDKSYDYLMNKNDTLLIDDTVNYVEGRWTSQDHKELSDNSSSNNDVAKSNTMAKIFKLGAAYPDKNMNNPEVSLARMSWNPEWHGNFIRVNYLACYMYATELARAGGNPNLVDLTYVAPEWYAVYYDEMNKKVNTNKVGGKKWETILADFNYANVNKSTQKQYRKYFIYGMAMHIASDAFAHSSYDSNKAYIDHTNGNADNRWYGSYSRWQAANGVASDVFYCMKNNYEGDLQDFSNQYKYFDGTFYLGNIIWFADALYGYTYYEPAVMNRLSRLSTGKYVDFQTDYYNPAYKNYQ